MTQHALSARGDNEGQWLPLTEYSVRSGISLSTIRRKIKTNTIPFRLERGRYLILYRGEKASAWGVNEEGGHESYSTDARPATPATYSPPPAATPGPALSSIAKIATSVQPGTAFEDALHMIGDAFEHAIREKDERIQLLEHHTEALEERVTELKTLVRVLEEKYAVRY